MTPHVECLGLPGAGKSALCTGLVRTLTPRLDIHPHAVAVRLCLRRRNDGLLKNLLKRCPHFFWERFMGTEYALDELRRFCAEHVPLLHALFATLAQRALPPDQSRLIIRACYRLGAEFRLFEDHLRPGEQLLLDEGFAQRCFTLFGFLDPPASRAQVESFLAHAPLPAVVVWTDAEPSICLQRIQRRDVLPRPWFAGLPPERLRAELTRARTCIEAIVAALESRGTPVIQVATNNNPDDALRQAEAAVDAHLKLADQ